MTCIMSSEKQDSMLSYDSVRPDPLYYKYLPNEHDEIRDSDPYAAIGGSDSDGEYSGGLRRRADSISTYGTVQGSHTPVKIGRDLDEGIYDQAAGNGGPHQPLHGQHSPLC